MQDISRAEAAAPGGHSSWFWLAFALLLLGADQITKQWIVSNYRLGEWTAVTGFFNIVRAHNTGAAFSFLAGAGGWQRWLFVAIGAVAAGVIIWQLRSQGRNQEQRTLYCLALAGILGGAMGNVLDRLRYGYVVDFLDFYWARWHFPAFNVADSAISVSVVCLVADEWLRLRRARV